MYLVIEKSKGIYASFETENHFKQAESFRQNLRRLPPSVLDNNCDLNDLGDHFYIVVPVTPSARRGKKIATPKQRGKTRRNL